MPCLRVTPSLLVLALIQLGLSTWAVSFGPFPLSNASPVITVILHLVLVAAGFWSTVEKKDRHPVVCFITLLVTCGGLDIYFVIEWYLYWGSAVTVKICLMILAGINLLSKVVTLGLAFIALKRQKQRQYHCSPESGTNKPLWMPRAPSYQQPKASGFHDQTEKRLPPPPYYQLQLQVDPLPQQQGSRQSPAQALHAALESHPASIQLAKLAGSAL